MKSIIKKIYYSLPWKITDIINYYRAFRCLPNIKSPKSLNEKVLYRKRHSCYTDPLYPTLADKYLVRNYVEEKIGSGYLIPLLGCFKNTDELKNELEKHSSFVLKPNHGAGMVKIVDSAISEEQVSMLLAEAKRWMETDFSSIMGEVHYSKINRRVLMEKRIGTEGCFLVDYKIHLFKDNFGDYFYVLQVIDDRFKGELSRTFYVNNLDEKHSGVHELSDDEKDKLKEAIKLSEILMDDLEYARVDWYIQDGQLLFGEITLTPVAGLGTGYGSELDILMGSKWNLALSPR